MRFASLLIFAVSACITPAQADQSAAAMGVMKRLLGAKASMFKFSQIPKEGKLDRYEINEDARGVHIRASSGVAMCRGAYDFLKQRYHCLVTWDGDQISLAGSPTPGTRYLRLECTCPNQYRHYFNVCTFGYTTAFWDWTRWQREIDWMALHGINMPLAMNGQERIWETVWK